MRWRLRAGRWTPVEPWLAVVLALALVHGLMVRAATETQPQEGGAAALVAPTLLRAFNLTVPPFQKPSMRLMQRILQRVVDCNAQQLVLGFNWTRPAFPVTVYECGPTIGAGKVCACVWRNAHGPSAASSCTETLDHVGWPGCVWQAVTVPCWGEGCMQSCACRGGGVGALRLCVPSPCACPVGHQHQRMQGGMPRRQSAPERVQACRRTRPDAGVHVDGSSNDSSIVTAIDSRVTLQLPTMLNSLYAHNSDMPLHVAVLTLLDNGTEAYLGQLCGLRRQLWAGLRLTFVVLQPAQMNTFFAYDSGSRGLLKHVSVATMARLLMPDLLPDLERAVWMDVDVVVVAPIRDLLQRRACLPPRATAAFPVVGAGAYGTASTSDVCGKTSVRDNMYGWLTPDVRCTLGVRDNTRQFNAGVLVLELGRMRAWGFSAFAVFVSQVFAVNDQVSTMTWAWPSKQQHAARHMPSRV